MSTENKINLICPYCGNNKFFRQKMSYSGTWEFEVNNHGDCDDTCNNADMYEDAIYKLKSVYYFCEECNRKVAKIPEDRRY